MKKKKNGKIWTIAYLIIVGVILFVIGFSTYYVDPFLHFHKPHTDKFYYTLNNQRSQNVGIIKWYDFDALITGSSMTENFKTTQLDEIFDTKSIKLNFSGCGYSESNNIIAESKKINPNLKMVIKSLDLNRLIADKDRKFFDEDNYPEYLYDDNVLNDVKYILNRDVFEKRVVPMFLEKLKKDFEPGITSFDDYSSWTKFFHVYGVSQVCPEGIVNPEICPEIKLSDEEKQMVMDNVKQNLTDIADANPDMTFYYFYPPYSVIWWKNRIEDYSIYKQIEAEKMATKELLKHPNIKVFHFNELYDVTSDLTNYRDKMHYGEWINSDLLRYMKEDKYLLTKENYIEKFDEELDFYLNFDYESLNSQGTRSLDE